MGSVTDQKAELRKRMRALRDGLSAGDRRQWSEQIVAHLRALPVYQMAKGVLMCIPYGSEPDLMPLLDEPDGRSVYIPRADFGTRSLAICRYPCQSVETSFGLSEPAADVPCLAEDEIDGAVDLAIIPGVAFSRSTLHRLGYGGGFFDVVLARHAMARVGVAHECQLLDAIPHDEHDVPMDAVVTEGGVIT